MYREASDPITVWVHFSLIKSGGRHMWGGGGGPTVTSPAAPQHKPPSLFDGIPEMMHLLFNLLFRSVSIFYSLIGRGAGRRRRRRRKEKKSSICVAQKPQRVSPAESWLSPCGFADGAASQQLCK